MLVTPTRLVLSWTCGSIPVYYRPEGITVQGNKALGRPSKNPNRIVAFLNDEQMAALKKISERNLAPVSALVRKAVEEFLRRQK